MKGTIVNYRGSYKEQNTNQMIISIDGITTKADTKKVIGKKAVWTSPAGKKITGIITSAHGSKGCVKSSFHEKGLPGQSLGQQVEIE